MINYRPTLSFSAPLVDGEDIIRGDETEAVDFLARLADGGPALELGIGTGRIALPLAARGVRVDGIDFSEAMIGRLREKPGGEGIDVTVGNFVDVGVGGHYRLIYVVFNTFFNLLTQDEQVRCFENVAAHLAAGGVFVIEAYVPTFLHRLDADQHVRAGAVEVDAVVLDVLRHDAARQMIDENHVRLTSSGAAFAPVVQRYAWPAELDLMARIAGLRLRERWGGWGDRPYESSSERHVSVYERIGLPR